MTDPTETRLRRLFAEAAEPLPGESFVAAVQADMAARRRRRKTLLVAAWTVVAITLALVLAPLAPPDLGQFSLGQSLTGLPEQLAATVDAGATQLRSASVPSYLYWVLGSCALPLIIVAWVFRRARL
jgi:hypothetical protein